MLAYEKEIREPVHLIVLFVGLLRYPGYLYTCTGVLDPLHFCGVVGFERPVVDFASSERISAGITSANIGLTSADARGHGLQAGWDQSLWRGVVTRPWVGREVIGRSARGPPIDNQIVARRRGPWIQMLKLDRKAAVLYAAG